MSIAFITTDYKPRPGGIAEHIYRLALNFHRSGHEVHVIAPHYQGDHEFDACQPFITHRYGNGGGKCILHLASLLLRLSRRCRFDYFYHAAWFPEGLTTRYLAPILSSRRIVAAHGVELLYSGRSLRRRIKRIVKPLQVDVYNSASFVFAVSNYTRRRLVELGVRRERVHVFPNGVDPQREVTAAEVEELKKRFAVDDGPIVLTVARLEDHKGHDVVLKALPKVIAKAPRVKYVIVGDGPSRQRLELLVNSLGLEQHVLFRGFVPDEERAVWLAACDVFVMPSRETPYGVEGFGIAYLEAHAFGKPTIGGRSGGVPDVIIHGETGWLVDPNDAASVADAIVRLLTDRELARKLGETAQERVGREFTWSKIVKSMEALMLDGIYGS